jgi:hypothetical protein
MALFLEEIELLIKGKQGKEPLTEEERRLAEKAGIELKKGTKTAGLRTKMINKMNEIMKKRNRILSARKK